MFKTSLLQSLVQTGDGRGSGGVCGGAHLGIGKEKMIQNIEVLELKIGQLIVKFGGGVLAMLCNIWNLSSPTTDQTHTPCTGSTEL